MIPWRSVLLAAAVLCVPTLGHAQSAKVLTGGCASINVTGLDTYPQTMDSTGQLCTSGTSGAATSTVTLSTLDIKTVTTGGTPVNAISAGNRVKGGWLKNPGTATVSLCINEIGTASGTTSSGDTTCIDPGQSYTIAPAAGAVSVVTSDSSHPFSGMGFK